MAITSSKIFDFIISEGRNRKKRHRHFMQIVVANLCNFFIVVGILQIKKIILNEKIIILIQF